MSNVKIGDKFFWSDYFPVHNLCQVVDINKNEALMLVLKRYKQSTSDLYPNDIYITEDLLDIYYPYTKKLEKEVELKDKCNHKEVIYYFDNKHIKCKFCKKFMEKYVWFKKFPNGKIDDDYWKNNPDKPGMISIGRP